MAIITLPIVGQEISKANFGDPVATELNERGVLAWVQGASADQVFGATVTDITGLTATFTAKPNRIYRTMVTATIQQNTAAAVPQLLISTGAGSQLTAFSHTAAVGQLSAVCIMYIETGISGTQTRKIQGLVTAGNCTFVGSFSRRASFCVECIG